MKIKKLLKPILSILLVLFLGASLIGCDCWNSKEEDGDTFPFSNMYSGGSLE